MISPFFPLDTLSQQPRINRLYTQLTFCCELAEDSASVRQDILRTLSDGFQRLAASFPRVAGRVVNCNGVYRIEPSETVPEIVVQDRRDDPSTPTWRELERARFPFKMLDESALAPVKTLSDDSTPTEPSVLLLQATFVSGGLLLTFCGQHGAMDMAGQAGIIRLFATACRNDSFSEEELRVGSMPRFDILSLPYHHHPGQHPTSIPNESMAAAGSDPKTLIPSSKWTYLSFPSPCLRWIKAMAEADIPFDAFVSTDDALSAYVWKVITRTRLRRLSTSAATGTDTPASSPMKTTLSRNVNMRQHLGLPADYLGLVVTSTVHTMALDELDQTPLGHIASRLRASLQDVDALRGSFRDDAVAAITRNDGNGKGRPDQEVRLTSWAKETCYDVDFGLGHGTKKPAAVRRPAFSEGARDGLVIFLPKGLDGSIVVGVCLREDDLVSLQSDGEVARMCEYID